MEEEIDIERLNSEERKCRRERERMRKRGIEGMSTDTNR